MPSATKAKIATGIMNQKIYKENKVKAKQVINTAPTIIVMLRIAKPINLETKFHDQI